MKPKNPRTICRDGTSLSIQASASHFCEPQDDVGPYTHYEADRPVRSGAVVVMPDEWKEYQDDPSSDFCVYARVPKAVVDRFIVAHGGSEDVIVAEFRRGSGVLGMEGIDFIRRYDGTLLRREWSNGGGSTKVVYEVPESIDGFKRILTQSRGDSLPPIKDSILIFYTIEGDPTINIMASDCIEDSEYRLAKLKADKRVKGYAAHLQFYQAK